MEGSNDSDETEISCDEGNGKSFTKITDASVVERGLQRELELKLKKKQTTELETSVSAAACSLTSPRKVWSKGEYCMAPFSGDSRYYKAVIRKIHRQVIPFQAQVSFIGYESEEDENVPIDSLRHEVCDSRPMEVNRSMTESMVKSDLAQCSFHEKEKDTYMRQKYESTDDEAVCHASASTKMKKLKKLNFRKCGSHSRSRRLIVQSSEDKVQSSEDKVQSGGKRSFDVAESSKNEKQASGKEQQSTPKEWQSSNKEGETCNKEGETSYKEGESHKKERQTSWGFTDSDLEKPHFQIKPIADKVPFCISKEFTKPLCNIPAVMNQYLRDYQRDGVSFMYNHVILEQGCILGDDMGLGKTVQVIALIAAHFGKTGGRQDAMPSYLMKTQRKEQEARRKEPFLIICPSSVLFNWEDELSTWGYFRTGRFHGACKKEALVNAERGKLEIVLTTYETFRIHKDVINEVKWFCVVMDEAHKVKEPDSQVTKAAKNIGCARRIGLTGTPMQNNMEELWCLLDWANPGCLGSLENFRNEFVLPIKLGQRFDATKRELATARKKQQEFGLTKEKWILRRTKALLKQQLPRKDERAVFAPLTQLQVALYEAILGFPSSKSVIHSSDPCDCSSGKARIACCHKLTKDDVIHHRKEIFHVITLLRKVANHAALLLPYHRASDKQKELALSICKNLFGTFPVLEDVYRNGSFAKMSDARFSGKLKILGRLLAAARDEKDKVLMFSTSVQLLNILEAYVISKGYNYGRFDGETKPDARIGIVREFNNNPDVFICLVSTKAGGLGLNFTGANVVVIFDPAWNPSFDSQAEDRAYRIGQRRNVRVYRLIAEGSIEENIYLRQIYKQQLSNIAVHSRNERRLFMGVAGVRSMQGELFGLRNLLVLRPEGSNLTSDLLKRTEDIESGVQVVNYEVQTNQAEFSKFDHSVMGKTVDKDGDKTSQSITEFTSSIDSFVDNGIALSGEEDEEGEVVSNDGGGIASGEESHSSSTDDEPPLKCKGSRRRHGGKRSIGKAFTALRRPRRIETDCSSDNEAASKKCKSAVKIDRTFVKNQLDSRKDSSSSKDQEPMTVDGILDRCGVKYTSTVDKVMSKSIAEEKMTTEAIRDVFWHGMYSQEPAHFINPSSSEESDDIPFASKEIVTKSEEDRKDAERKSYPASISRRVFERIGSDMFLIGATPPLIRRQQFESIACHYGFDSSLEFARSLVMSTEDQVREKLFEFYKANEPNIVETSSFKSIYGARTSRAEPVNGNDDLNAGSVTNSEFNHKSFRSKRNSYKNQWVFEEDLDLASGVSIEDVGGKKDLLSMVKNRFENKELLCGIERCLSSTIENVRSSVKSRSKVISVCEDSSDCANNCAVKATEVEIEEQGNYEETVKNEKRRTKEEKHNEIDDKELLSEGDSVESSEGMLDELMFNPVYSPVDRPNEAVDNSAEKHRVGSSDNHTAFSILDELMNDTVAVEPADSNDKGQMINPNGKSSGSMAFQDSDSQRSISVLDELMG